MSEFGKGFTYCLGLFLAHAERNMDRRKNDDDAELWFNGAADHLFEFDADNAPEPLRERCKAFKDRCIDWRIALSFWDRKPTTWKDVYWAVKEAKDILREYDKLNGFEVEEGEWE